MEYWILWRRLTVSTLFWRFITIQREGWTYTWRHEWSRPRHERDGDRWKHPALTLRIIKQRKALSTLTAGLPVGKFPGADTNGAEILWTEILWPRKTVIKFPGGDFLAGNLLTRQPYVNPKWMQFRVSWSYQCNSKSRHRRQSPRKCRRSTIVPAKWGPRFEKHCSDWLKYGSHQKTVAPYPGNTHKDDSGRNSRLSYSVELLGRADDVGAGKWSVDYSDECDVEVEGRLRDVYAVKCLGILAVAKHRLHDLRNSALEQLPHGSILAMNLLD